MSMTLDQTTGFYIFREFINRSEQQLASGHERDLANGHTGLVCIIDISNLDKIGEYYGQHTSENVLQKTALQLQASLQDDSAILGRLDRKSLAVLLPEPRCSADELGQALLAGINSHIDLQDSSHNLKIVVGISACSYNMTESLNQCRIALSRITKGTELVYNCFTAEDEARLERSRKVSQAFIEALRRNDLELYYQPQVSIRHQHLAGVEALLRWELEGFGNIPPSEIIRTAQHANMAITLDNWVLENACRQLAAWLAAGLRPVPVSVNLMGESLEDPLLITRVRELLDKYAIDPALLHLEILETAVIEEFDLIIPQLLKIRDLGVSFSLDDFGTGYSSLRYLQRLPVRIIKIDKGFIHEMLAHPEDAVLTSSIIALAHGLGMEVIAEGVETLEQYTLLKNYNCDLIQGYIFSQALPVEDITRLLHSGNIFSDPETA